MFYWTRVFSQSITSFRNHTTDHHAIVFRLPLYGTKISDSFLLKMNFDGEHWTKKTKRKMTRHEESETLGNKRAKTTQENPSLDMNCLLSPNWLTSEVIDEYLKLLQKHNPNIFIFETAFYEDLQCGGFESLKAEYKAKDVLSYRKLFIPIIHRDSCFLVSWDKSEVCLLDPYDLSRTQIKEQELAIYQSHMKLLIILKEVYFKPMYESQNKIIPNNSISIMMPPKIPTQLNAHDCGVFLLMFLKFQTLDWKFDFHSDDMIKIRNMIK